ncbi:MAG: hypothetical protein ACRD4K_01065 [Candidatus Acidiferrales bacterium]
MLLFRSEEHVDRWCLERNLPKGALLTMEQGWGLAKGWYGDRLDPDWKPKSETEMLAAFAELGLTGEFWQLR